MMTRSVRPPDLAIIMRVDAVKPEIDVDRLLAGAQFIDAFGVTVEDAALDARQAAERMLGRSPRWVEMLTALRNALVAPFGLKTSLPKDTPPASAIGIFPIVTQTSTRLVAGFDDKHLDFRVVVDVATSGRVQRVTATTLVLTHNLLGRAYLGTILPFHRLVVRAMLRQVAA
jgi:uncharacterized protein DUF2867